MFISNSKAKIIKNKAKIIKHNKKINKYKNKNFKFNVKLKNNIFSLKNAQDITGGTNYKLCGWIYY